MNTEELNSRLNAYLRGDGNMKLIIPYIIPLITFVFYFTLRIFTLLIKMKKI